MSKKVFIKTFGCQMNVYDSNRILDAIKKIGFTKTEKITRKRLLYFKHLSYKR